MPRMSAVRDRSPPVEAKVSRIIFDWARSRLSPIGMRTSCERRCSAARGRTASSGTSPSPLMITARSTAFFSSRTLPGQS